jgi:hypothetical protein
MSYISTWNVMQSVCNSHEAYTRKRPFYVLKLSKQTKLTEHYKNYNNTPLSRN